jgi:aldose 1-epimerase
MKAVCLLALAMSAHAQYSATCPGEVARLEDKKAGVSVAVLPSVGNIAYEMKVGEKNVFWFPFASPEDFRKKPVLSGNPLLAPWANRLDENAFYANGKKYLLNLDLGNVRLDGFRHPIHGLVLFTPDWRVTDCQADAKGAWVTSRLEFARRPDWLAQFPFAHTIEITYRLSGGTLEIRTRVTNQSADTMPLSLGYHPYFRITDAPRDDWTVSIPARSQYLLNDQLLPTGETRPATEALPNPAQVLLRRRALDHVFGELPAEATFSVKGKSQRIEVVYGPKYRVAVVYAPQGPNRDFICFEPMTGPTNAFNLAHRGIYKELQTVPAGQTWQESFWVRPSGF